MPEKKLRGVANTRRGRIRNATKYGGLQGERVPESYEDQKKDWETANSPDYFERLYLDFRQYKEISGDTIAQNHRLIKKFWDDRIAYADSDPGVAREYVGEGGINALRALKSRIDEAKDKLTKDGGPEQCFREIVKTKLETHIRPKVEARLETEVFTATAGDKLRTEGGTEGIELTREEITEYVVAILNEKGWVPAAKEVDDPLSVAWGPPNRKETETRDNLKVQKDLDTFISEFLTNSVYQGDISPVKKKSRELGFPEEQALTRFEQAMRTLRMSPDAEKVPDDIRSRLSLFWRTEEGKRKHREEQRNKDLEREKQAQLDATDKFTELLDNKLANGLYRPSDYVDFKQMAPEYLKRNVTALDEILIQHLKQKGFKPAKFFPPGSELSVKWRTPWANPSHWLRNTAVGVLIVLFLIAGYYAIAGHHVIGDHPEGPRDAARIVALEAVRQGTGLSLTISKLPKLEEVLIAAKNLQEISPRYQKQVTSANNSIESARKTRDKYLMGYIAKTIELSRYTSEQISYAIGVVENGDQTPREKIVSRLLTEDVKSLQSGTKPDPSKILTTFNKRFSNFID